MSRAAGSFDTRVPSRACSSTTTAGPRLAEADTSDEQRWSDAVEKPRNTCLEVNTSVEEFLRIATHVSLLGSDDRKSPSAKVRAHAEDLNYCCYYYYYCYYNYDYYNYYNYYYHYYYHYYH